MNRKIKNWCFYCKGEILEGEPFVVFAEETYHPECFQQSTTYFDALEFEEDE